MVYTRERTLEKRLKDGDYEQAMSMVKVGLHGLNAMLPGILDLGLMLAGFLSGS